MWNTTDEIFYQNSQAVTYFLQRSLATQQVFINLFFRDHIIVHRDNGDITYLDGPSEPRKKRKSRAVNIDAIEDTKDGIFDEFDELDNDSSYVANDTKTLELLDTERPYRCCECGRGFTSEPRLATHMKDHRKGRQFIF